MKKVLWISRHQMTEDQIADLKRALQDDIDITAYTETVKSIVPLLNYIDDADVICAVLPVSLLAEVKAAVGEKMLLQSVSGRMPTGKWYINDEGKPEKEFKFVHLYWEQIEELVVRTKKI